MLLDWLKKSKFGKIIVISKKDLQEEINLEMVFNDFSDLEREKGRNRRRIAQQQAWSWKGGQSSAAELVLSHRAFAINSLNAFFPK